MSDVFRNFQRAGTGKSMKLFLTGLCEPDHHGLNQLFHLDPFGCALQCLKLLFDLFGKIDVIKCISKPEAHQSRGFERAVLATELEKLFSEFVLCFCDVHLASFGCVHAGAWSGVRFLAIFSMPISLSKQPGSAFSAPSVIRSNCSCLAMGTASPHCDIAPDEMPNMFASFKAPPACLIASVFSS